MKRFAVVMALCLLSLPAFASKDGLGAGIIVGDPTGVSLKKWTSDTEAFDAAAAWSFSGRDSFVLHADYLIHNFEALKLEGVEGRLPLHFGVGGQIDFHDDNGKGNDDDDVRLSIRIPVGVTYLFNDNPFELFAELVPTLEIAPDTDFEINAAVGVRYYFK